MPQAVHKGKVFLVVEKHLRHHILRALANLLHQVLHVRVQVHGLLVLLGIARHAVGKGCGRRVAHRAVNQATFVEAVHLSAQVDGMLVAAGVGRVPVFTPCTVAAQHQQFVYAEKGEVEEFLLNFGRTEAAADDVRNGGHAVAPLDGGGNGHRAGTGAHAEFLESAVAQLVVDGFRAVGGDVDATGVEGHEAVDGAVHALYALAAHGGQHLKRESRPLSALVCSHSQSV